MQSIVRDAKSRLINEFFEHDLNQLQKVYPSMQEMNVSKKEIGRAHV